MKTSYKLFVLTIIIGYIFTLTGCMTPQTEQQQSETKPKVHKDAYISDVELPKSVEIPSDGSSPIAGLETAKNPTTTITFNGYGEKQFVRTGQTANFIFEGIDPTQAQMIYESTDGGYLLFLHKGNEPIAIHFSRLCQSYIVQSPTLTSFTFDKSIRFEQIIWTPREEGNWEVRMGSTQRGCKSDALNRINKLRTPDYERESKSKIIK